MKRKEMYVKYAEAISGISEANKVDVSVALDILIYEYRVRTGEIERTDTYAGIPGDVDWDGIGEYLAQLRGGANEEC